MNAFKNFLNRLVGKEIGEDQELVFQWAYLPDSWRLFLFIAIVLLLSYGIFWLYRREIDTAPRSVKIALATLRFLTLLFLVLLFLQPSLATVTTSERKPNIMLLEDASQSMDRTDKYRFSTSDPDASADDATDDSSDDADPIDMSGKADPLQELADATGFSIEKLSAGEIKRTDIVNRLLKKGDDQFVRSLRTKGSVRVYRFSDKVEDLGTLPAISNVDEGVDETSDGAGADSEGNSTDESGETVGNNIVTLAGTGSATDIWQALKESLSINQLAAIVLISDGQHTTPDDPVEIASRASELGVPIYVLGVGDPGRPKNLFVSDVYVRSKAQPGEPFEIESVIYAQNISAKSVNVELLRSRMNDTTNEPEQPQSVKSESIPIPNEGGRIPVNFSESLDDPGKYAYSVRVAEVEDESSVEDNVKMSSPVEVIDEKVKVLLVAGAPTWEYQMVQRLLQRDQSILLSCWLQTMDKDRPQEGDEPISEFPKTLLELGKYNVVMMFDPNPDEFSDEFMDVLAQFAEDKAGGVLYKAGPKYTDLFLTLERTKRLREILPVEFSSSDEADVTRYLQSASTSSAPLQIVIPNLDHPVMTFHRDRRDNLQRWQSMPGIFWSYPAVRAKPTSRVLLEHSDITMASDGENSRPLLVSGRYVRGNTLYIGFNGTWRWRRMGRQAQFFDRFWIQTIRFLVETRSLQGLRRGVVEPDRDVYEVGDRIVFRARLQDQTFQPLKIPEVAGTIDLGDGQTQSVALKKLETETGEYEAVMTAQRIGEFVMTVALPGADSEDAIEPVSFRVEAPRVETAAFWLNEKLLRDIAEASGGGYYTAAEFAELPDQIETSVEEIQWQDRPKPLWDVNNLLRTLCFCIPVILLTIEWALRKGFKLL